MRYHLCRRNEAGGERVEDCRRGLYQEGLRVVLAVLANLLPGGHGGRVVYVCVWEGEMLGARHPHAPTRQPCHVTGGDVGCGVCGVVCGCVLCGSGSEKSGVGCGNKVRFPVLLPRPSHPDRDNANTLTGESSRCAQLTVQSHGTTRKPSGPREAYI